MTWQAGDIGAVSGTAFVDRLIQFGQMLRHETDWRWNHIFIVTDDNGGTVEATGHGVKHGTLDYGKSSVFNLGCPVGVDRAKVVACALSHVGDPYSYFDVTLLGVDCLLDTKFHQHHGKSVICSELAVECLIAGGWKSPLPAALMKPADVVHALGGTSHLT